MKILGTGSPPVAGIKTFEKSRVFFFYIVDIVDIVFLLLFT